MARKDSEKDKEYHKKYRQTEKYKKWHRIWAKEWRRKNPEKSKAIWQRSHKKNYESYKIRHNKYLRDYTKRLRIELIDKYGGKCNCCGEKNIGFLSIDHINGDGVNHRKTFHGSTRELYRDLARKGNSKNYQIQILCFNCNMGRQFYGGEEKLCPHKLKK